METDPQNAPESEPENLPKSTWLTLILFAAFVVGLGTCVVNVFSH